MARTDAVVSFMGTYGTLVVLAAMVVVFSVMLGGRFFSMSNLQNVLIQSVIGTIIALGVTFILMTGEFDVSVGYTASLTCMMTAAMFRGPLIEKTGAVVLIVIVGACIGVVNGLVITKLGVNALVGTMGIGTVVLGVNFWLTAGTPQMIDPSGRGLTRLFLEGDWPVPPALIILVVVVVGCWLISNKTTLGLEMRAVGGNRTAAQLSGIRVHRVIISCFALGTALYAIGGILVTANVGSGQINGGDGYLMASFAAAYLGSAALRNGEFHVVGTLIGVITVAVGTNGMAILGVSTAVNYAFQGILLVFAVAMSSVARRSVRQLM